MTQPLVSVLLPTHARYKSGHLQRAVESVVTQAYTNFELIIVDDGSLDGTEDYLRQQASRDKRIKHIRLEENVGLPGYLMALAFLRSEGEFVAMAFDDCQFRPHHLQKLVEVMQQDERLGLVYGQTCFHTSAGEQLIGKDTSRQEMESENPLGNAAVLLRRQAIDAVGCSDPHIILKRTCDWDMWIRIFRRFPVAFVPEPVADEYGPQLPGSLGRCTQLFPSLVKRYMQVDRNAILTPDRIVSGQHSVTDVPFSLGRTEQTQLNLLILEHYISVGNMREIVRFSGSLLGEGGEEVEELWCRIGRGSNDAAGESSRLLMLGISYYMRSNTISNNYMAELESYHARLLELSKSHIDYHNLQRSISWRLTKPLRDLKALTARKKHSTE